MRAHRIASVAGIALAVVMGAAACGGGTPSPPLSARGQQSASILAGLLPKSESDQFELEMAGRQQQLDAACMAAHQLAYVPRDPRSLIDTVTETDFTSLAYAKTYGFGVTTFPHLAGADPNAAALAALPQDRRTAFTDQLNACDTAANDQVDHEYDVAVANQVFGRVDQIVRDDPRYRDALGAWRKCAAAAGYQQVDRTALIDSFRQQMSAIRDDLSVAAAQSGSPGDATTAALATHDDAFLRLHQREVDAATRTFPCSQRLDATYRTLYESHTTPTGEPKA
jgi:hypothetical protein